MPTDAETPKEIKTERGDTIVKIPVSSIISFEIMIPKTIPIRPPVILKIVASERN